MSRSINPADKVELWPIDRLIPSARNARTHSDAQVAQIAASIREWGLTTAVLVDPDGNIIAGHGRVLAARQIGIAEMPVMVASGWSDAKKRAYLITDNKLAMNAGWNDDLLALEISDLGEMGFDVALTGFGADEIAALTPLPPAPADTSPQLTDGFKFSVIVAAKDEQDQAVLLERFESEGLKCRPLITQ